MPDKINSFFDKLKKPVQIKLRIWVCILGGGLLLSNCAMNDISSIDNLSDGNILAIGHAGLGFNSYVFPFNPYPPNSFTALKKAIEYGADGVEVDLQLTKDGVLVLYHDYDLANRSSLEGCIGDKTWDELKNLTYDEGVFFNAFQSEKIIRLDSLLSWFSTLREFPHLHFDMKPYNECNPENGYATELLMCGLLDDQIVKFNAPTEKLVFISARIPIIEELRSLNSEYIVSYEETEDFNRGLEKTIQHGIEILTIKPTLITRRKVKKAQSKNIKVLTFGAKSRSGNIKLIELNPDIIHTNNIEMLLNLLDEAEAEA